MLLIHDDAGVRTMTLNRPEQLNALDYPGLDALADAIIAAANDDAVRCLVVTGAGRGFCSGADLRANARLLRQDPALPPAERLAPLSLEGDIARVRRWSAAVRLLRDMPKATIAMINGPCAGAGLSIAGACDLRFAARSAVFVSAFAEAGFSGDLGGSWYWTRHLGSARARELYLLSEKMDAARALEFGLVHRIYDDAVLQDESFGYARILAARHPRVAGYIKANLAEAEGGTIDSTLLLEGQNAMLSVGRWTRDERNVPSKRRPE